MTSDPLILSLSTLYPNPLEPGKGLFVRHRLDAVSALVNLRLAAPVSGWASLSQTWQPSGSWNKDGNVNVLWTKWWPVPGIPYVAPQILSANLHSILNRLAERPTLLDAQFGFPDGPAVARVARRHRLPYTVTLRGSEVLHATYSHRRRLLAEALRGASRVLTVSERLRKFAVSMGVSEERTKTIANGVDSQIFSPAPDKDSIRLRWGVPANTPLLVAAGNLIPLKGFDRLIRAVHELRLQGVSTRLVIAGMGGFDTAYESQLRALPSKLHLAEHVTFCGRLDQPDLASLMSAADLFCLSSVREGWPNVVHEAMACGTPIVASDVGAIPELLPDDRYGIKVSPTNIVALAQGIHAALHRNWNRNAILEWATSRSWHHAALELANEWGLCVSAQSPIEREVNSRVRILPTI